MHDEAPAPADLAPFAQRIGAGDRVAKDEFARRFATPVHGMMLARTRDPATADDLTNEALMAALGSLREGRIGAPERLSAFDYGAARNVLNNYFRARGRHPAEMTLPAEIPADPQADPVEDKERPGLVREALDQLDDTDRRILRTIRLKGLGPEEIARTLRLRPDFVRARKSRAVKKIGEIVGTSSQIPSERPLYGRRRQ
jgi:RNA polymerase sigma-70 factor (ECF subfamily)